MQQVTSPSSNVANCKEERISVVILGYVTLLHVIFGTVRLIRVLLKG
jgi:hypothetical protein